LACLVWLLIGMVSLAQAGEVVIGDFEDGLDGWEERDATFSLSETGATLGAQAMQVDADGAWKNNGLVDLRPHLEVMKKPGLKITADVTVFDADLNTTWMNIQMVINGQNNDDNGANNNIGWQTLDSLAVTRDGVAHTYEWTLPEDLATAIAGVDESIAWFQLAVITNLDGASVTKFYIDNIQLSYDEPTASQVIGNFECALDGWFERDATISLSKTGATVGSQAMQVEGPGGWHIDCLLDLQPHRTLLGVPGVKIKADVTAFDADLNTTWMNMEMIINGQNNDDNGAHNNIGWQTLGGQAIARDGMPQTLEWEVPEALTSAIAATDDTIGWFELAMVTNLDEGSATKFYIDNIQIVTPQAETGDADVILGNWEQSMDGWVAAATEDVDILFSDVNGVTLDNYSLDVYVANGDWRTVLTLNVLDPNYYELVVSNQEASLDVTRMVDDWPTDQVPGWNGIHLIVNAGGDGWSVWENLGYQAGWNQGNGDRTQTARWEYASVVAQMDLDNLSWFNLEIIVNANDPDYTGWVLFYLDNMRLSGAGRALTPNPANSATDIGADTDLSWTPGVFAATHHLYLGTNAGAVASADRDSNPDVLFVELTDATFQPEELLEFKTRYYWRIDEVNDAHPAGLWRGPVWNFITGDYIVVDDFESYSNVLDSGNTVFDTWIDGYKDDNNGSIVGHLNEPFSEPTIVDANTGDWSMPFYYDNTDTAVISEATRTFAEPQVWMEGVGDNKLTLFVYGAMGNRTGELYLIIEDSAGASHRVTYPDPAVFKTEAWHAWEISLNDVAAQGVNLAAVAKLTIGVANLPGESKASGLLYIDNIRRHPPVGVVLNPTHQVVPQTAAAPVIDGQWDALWDNVEATPCLISDMVNTDSAAPEDAADLSAVFKTLYDDAYFYVFVEIQDSVIDYEFSDWRGDGVEIYFDGDYSHGTVYDGVNDNQIRITVDDAELADIDSSLPIDGAVFKVRLTEGGYNIEAAIPLEALQIYPSEDPAPLLDADGVQIPNSGIAPNNIIGFEMQINDNDGGGNRETMLRWFSDDNNSYQDPSLFGQARLVPAD